MSTPSSAASASGPSVRPIDEVAKDLGLTPDDYELYGRNKAKVSLDVLGGPARGKGALILVTAINPTPGGEGKTTMSIGLAMGLRRLGASVALCLREPSLGPVFGVKGGGTGGGRASLYPADDINLHFTGDIHAITSANNLLSALIDNQLHFGKPVGDKGLLDSRSISHARVLDMNDRALRNVIVGLGGRTEGMPRQERFDITAASEVMAIVALAKDLPDLRARLGRMLVGSTANGDIVTASDLEASEAMTALLRDALRPNLVQTMEGGAALVHCGPFANIAHGCSSVVATRVGLHTSDFVVTEAGFGLDLGGEKFLDIKCRAMGKLPRVVVLVATLRALKMHGGATLGAASDANAEALEAGFDHLDKHLETLRTLGLPAVVAINVFAGKDSEAELQYVEDAVRARGVRVARCDAFASGGEGSISLAEAVRALVEGPEPTPQFAYELDQPIAEKIERIAKLFYGADGVDFTATAQKDLARIEKQGGAGLPICVAKTQGSLTDDPTRVGRPKGFRINVRGLRFSRGAGFIVALTGQMMTMPGLPKNPAAANVRIEESGEIRGLMQNS